MWSENRVRVSTDERILDCKPDVDYRYINVIVTEIKPVA